jgi:hypothetical protein
VPQSNSTYTTDIPNGDQRLDLFGGQPMSFGHDRDTRSIQIRKYVDFQIRRLPTSVTNKPNRQDNDEKSLTQCELDDCIEHETSFLVGMAMWHGGCRSFLQSHLH